VIVANQTYGKESGDIFYRTMLYFNPLAEHCPVKTVLLDRNRDKPIRLRIVIIYSVFLNIKTGFIVVLSNLNK
jgi:hypothetical protein